MTIKSISDVLGDLELTVSRGRAIASMLHTALDDASNEGENPDRIKEARDEMWYLVDRVEEEVGRLDALTKEAYAAWNARRGCQGKGTRPPARTPSADRPAELLQTLLRADDLVNEARAAELLDQALQARHESLRVWRLHEGDHQQPDVVAADEREAEAAAKLQALDPVSPAVAAAQLAFLVVAGESGANVFQGHVGYHAEWLDFQAVDEYDGGIPVQQGAAKVVAAYLRAHADSEVAAVIEKHRKLARERDARQEAAE